MDKYDTAIALLTRAVDEEKAAGTYQEGAQSGAIYNAWNDYRCIEEGCLFEQCKPSITSPYCGCLTQVRLGSHLACTQELTEMIRADERLPKRGEDIRLEHLPIFAEWQRKMDVMFNRK